MTATQGAANGTFDVKIQPLAAYNQAPEAMMARRSIDKQFHGALDATSQGEMLSAGTPVDGSAAYVALEQVRGRLDGRSGSFVLMHRATMTRGTPALEITVVPDSGTGELLGLAGRMGIRIADGAHFYEFAYTLPDAPP